MHKITLVALKVRVMLYYNTLRGRFNGNSCTHIECNNELSAHLAVQNLYVALLSVAFSADYLLKHSKFPLECSYFI